MRKLAQKASLERLQSLSNRQDIEVIDSVASTGVHHVYSHWMAMIMLAGEGGKLLFRTHYNSRDINLLAAKILNKNKGSLREGLIADFMREYCNLTAGVIKTRLASAGVNTGLSIPIVTRGFDEVWRRDRPGEDTKEILAEEAWMLRWATGSLICTVTFRTDVWNAVSSLKEEIAAEEDAVEFL